jgi:hypothetical protein
MRLYRLALDVRQPSGIYDHVIQPLFEQMPVYLAVEGAGVESTGRNRSYRIIAITGGVEPIPRPGGVPHKLANARFEPQRGLHFRLTVCT